MKSSFTLVQILAWTLMGLVFIPLIPGLAMMVGPLLSREVWLDVWRDSQWPQALQATLMSTTLGVFGALSLSLVILCGLWPGERWHRYVRRLPGLLAFPHVAFASGLLFIFSEHGWLTRLINLSFPVDTLGIGLGIMLALKEAWFLLWFASTQLNESELEQQLTVARSLGYGPLQSRLRVLVPHLLPRLRWALVAIIAYSLSTVDVAIVLGPSNPPTLAVLAWTWLNDSDSVQQAMGMAVSMLLLVILAGFAAAGISVWKIIRPQLAQFSGHRDNDDVFPLAITLSAGLSFIGLASVLILAIWSLAQGWFYPAILPDGLSVTGWQSAHYETLTTAFLLALASSLIAAMCVLLWLESAPRAGDTWILLPLILPALPLASGQYQVLLYLVQEGTWQAVIWSHLLWVIPYTLLILKPAWLRLDPRHALIARTFGWSSWKILWWVKIPLLLRPLSGAIAVGFSVSVAQYLPTLYAGAGRFATVTTEAVAQSSGGDPQQLAILALLQTLLPAIIFIITLQIARLATRHRQGLR